ncbi:MAG TPA: phosphate/phosphite/phosphonate ABC transporter substrate-binding protein [Acidiferrobacterales bacterium]|nr:phosphate/phosphite/phosphonate ABC transporter substrate-binding protein [Acidiferrobacterales bacterium]
MAHNFVSGIAAMLGGVLLGALVVVAALVLPPIATALLAGAGVAASVLLGSTLLRLRSESRSLAQGVEASIDHDLRLTADHFSKVSRPAVLALNRYGEQVTGLVGEAANRSNQAVLVSNALMESAEQMRSHAELQAQESTGLAAAMEEMNATIHEIANNSSSTFANATRIAQANADSMQNMNSVVVSVGDISALFDRTAQVMGDLRLASDEIGNIVQVINGIAEQTNLLALNAAIEAARAGEHGRGFAVVADEVRKLAEITKKSTREITDTIARNQGLTTEVCASMESGRNLIHKSAAQAEATNESLQVVAHSVDDVNGMIHQIASATEEQSATVAEIARNVEHIAQLSSETQSRAIDSRRTAEGLASVARELEERLGSYNLAFFGLAPTEDALHMNRSFAPLCAFINKVLGQRLFIRLGENYEQAIEDLGSGRALLSYQTPSTYVEARERYGIEPLVVPLAKGEPFYKSAVVVRADSGINSLAELRGKRFAFGDAKSTGSKAMPESMLREAGIGLRDLAAHGFVGSHDNVAKAVLQKNYDAGGLMLSAAEKYAGQGLKILATSAKIPQFPVCAAPQLSADDREKLTQALTALRDPQVLGALGAHVTGFARISDSDYDGVRAMLKRLKA